MTQVDGKNGITVNVRDYKTTKKPTGVTYALKSYVDKLISEGKAKLSDGSISKEEWEKTVKVLDEIKAARGDEGVSIFGFDWGHTKAGDITFSAEETEKLWKAMGVELTQTSETNDEKTKAKEKAKADEKAKAEEKAKVQDTKQKDKPSETEKANLDKEVLKKINKMKASGKSSEEIAKQLHDDGISDDLIPAYFKAAGLELPEKGPQAPPRR